MRWFIDQDMRDFDKRVGGTKASDPFFNNDQDSSDEETVGTHVKR